MDHMMSIFSVWIIFIALTLTIGVAGYQLSKYADIIAVRTGLGHNLIGLILLSAITSLPELIAGISSVRFANNPNLAVGDALGSCIFNLVLVFFIDLFHRNEIFFHRVQRGHLLTGALGMILISFVGFGILVNQQTGGLRIGHMGVFSLTIPVLYFLSMRMLYAFERNSLHEATPTAMPDDASAKISLKRAIGMFSLSSIAVVSAGAWLPFIAEKFVTMMGWNSAFVGTLILGLATSLPEVAVTVSALSFGAVDLALSNVLGSNLFNVVILAIDDLFYTERPLFQSVSSIHAVTAFSAVIMTGLVLVALIQPPQRRVLNLVSALSLLVLAVYAVNAYMIFIMG